jgi:hypothetical protein
MALIKALAAALTALAAFLKYVYPVKQIREIHKDIDKYEDQIMELGNIGDANSKLQLELLHQRKVRAERLLSVFTSYGDYPPR